MLPADACALAQEFTPPAPVPAPRGAELGSDGFIATAISSSTPAFPNSPNPLSRSVSDLGTEVDGLPGCTRRAASVRGCFHTQALGASTQSSHGSPPPRNFVAGSLHPEMGGRRSARPEDRAGLDRSRAPGCPQWGQTPLLPFPPAHEIQGSPGPRGSESASPRAASASGPRSKCFSVGEEVHFWLLGLVSFHRREPNTRTQLHTLTRVLLFKVHPLFLSRFPPLPHSSVASQLFIFSTKNFLTEEERGR